MMLLLVLLVNFGALFIDRYTGKNWKLTFATLTMVSIFFVLDIKGFFSLGTILAPLFKFISSSILGLIILGIGVLLLYFINYKLLRQNSYLDIDATQNKAVSSSTQSYTFFDRFSPEIGRLMELETKLILRNKRAKSFLVACVLFVFYPFLIASGDMDQFNSFAFLIFVSTFVVGSFTLNFGQIMISMNSAHFDFILGQNIKISDYLKAKFSLLALGNAFFLILSIPYVFISTKIVLVNVMMSLFMTGVVIFVYMALALKASKRFEINKGGMFNMQGFSASHFIIVIPMFVLPILIYLLFRAFDQRVLGVVMIGIFGAIGILSRYYWLDKMSRSLSEKKYTINAKFKK